MIEFLTLSDPNIRTVVIAVLLISVSTALTGSFLFLHKKALLGDAVSHSVLPGIGLGFLAVGEKDPLVLMIGAILSGAISIFFIDRVIKNPKVKPDAALAITLALFFSVGIVILSYIQAQQYTGQAGLNHFIFGKAAALKQSDALVFSVLALFVTGVIVMFFKEFKLIAFNKDYAISIGMPVKFLEFIMQVLVIFSIALGIQAVGVILLSALLITPAASARIWTNNLKKMLLLAVFFSMIPSYLGIAISTFSTNMPTGPWVVVSLTGVAILSIFFAPQKGVISRMFKARANRKKILLENILKDAFVLKEENNTCAIAKLIAHRQEETRKIEKGIVALEKENLLIRSQQNIQLTEAGINKGGKIQERHLLWEKYLTSKLKIKQDHVHYNAESIEHLLTEELVQELKNELKENHV